MSSPADRTGGGSSRLGRSKNDERIKRVRILATVPVIILAGVLSGRGSDWTTWRADSAREAGAFLVVDAAARAALGLAARRPHEV